MSISETKRLLRTFRIVPNNLLGQNFMIESSVIRKLVDYASIDKSDVVLDVGAGFGFLSRFIANRCKSVLAIEKDPRVAAALREQLKGWANVKVIEGDLLKVTVPIFNKVVSIPPYRISSKLLLWLFNRGFDCVVLVLQKEFADRLVAAVGSGNYGWLSVVTYYLADVTLLDPVSKHKFYPQPEVESVIVRLRPWKLAPFCVRDEAFFRRMVRCLFTHRNKKLSNALELFIKSDPEANKEDWEKVVSSVPFHKERVRKLPPEAFGDLANALVR